jgi:hypothetical protein
MEEETGSRDSVNGGDDLNQKEEVYSKVVRAGKRTYFFDVKATRKEDYYVTITESKRRSGKEGKIFFEKHKIFLYKEDFEKFALGLKDAINFIEEAPVTNNRVSEELEQKADHVNETAGAAAFTNIEFEDLGKK